MHFFDKLKKYKIINIIMALITYSVLCSYGIIKSYDILSWSILILLIFMYIKIDIKNKILKKDIIFLSILFSCLFVFGNIVYSLEKNRILNVFNELINFKNLFYIIGLFNLFFILLTYLIPKLYNYSLKKNNYKIKEKTLFFISLIVILLAWLPYFLNFYPGTLISDSFTELNIIVNNFSILSNHHPIFHVIFIAIPYNIGLKIFKTMTSGIALATIFQMLIMASIFAYFLVFLKKRKVSKTILILILLYYAILPMHGYYSISMLKDVVFSGSILLLTMQTIKIIERYNNNELKFRKFISFIFISLLCILFRNNAIYMYLIFMIVSLLLFKKCYKTLYFLFMIVLGIYFIIQGPVFAYFNVQKSASVEYIAIPLQQIGRMTFKNVEFTEKEKEMINELLPIEEMSLAYNPKIVDTIKFNLNFNRSSLDNNKLAYLKLWLHLIFKYPSIAIESYAISTLGYWYPGVEYWSVVDGIDNNRYNITTESKLPNFVDKVLKEIKNKDFPILNIEWSIGLCFWIILIFLVLSLRINGIKGIYPYIPVFGIWLTMMIAAPVYAELRYVYGAYTSLPLLVLSPYLIKNQEVRNQDEKK